MSDFLITGRPEAAAPSTVLRSERLKWHVFLLLPARPPAQWLQGGLEGRAAETGREGSMVMRAETRQGGLWFGSRFSLSAQFIPTVRCSVSSGGLLSMPVWVSFTVQTGTPSFQGAYFL